MFAPVYTPRFFPRGITLTQTLEVYDGASLIAITDPDCTYTLFDPAGEAVSTGTATGGSFEMTLAEDAPLGQGWREVWVFEDDDVSYTVKISVIVTDTLDSRFLLVDHNSIVQRHAWLATMPTGYTTWEPICIAVTREIFQLLAERTRQGRVSSDLLNADVLFHPALALALARIGEQGAALTGSESMKYMAEQQMIQFRDFWERADLRFDTDGDGVLDVSERPSTSHGFPRRSPARG